MSKERLVLYGLLSVIVVVLGLGLLSGWSMAENLFSEALGILLTVVVVDRLLSLDAAAAKRPTTLAAFKDAAALYREARAFAAAAARSTVPDEELDRVKTSSGDSSPWLYNHLGQITPNQCAPWTAEYAPPEITWMTWGQALPWQVNTLQSHISKYLERHAGTGDPAITEAVHDLEENGIFRSASYGSVFWMLGNSSGEMWRSFFEKFDRLGALLRSKAGDYPEIDLGPYNFDWEWLAKDIEAAMEADIRPAYRPSCTA